MTHACAYACVYVKISRVKPVLTVHLWYNETVFKHMRPFKRDSIHMKLLVKI